MNNPSKIRISSKNSIKKNILHSTNVQSMEPLTLDEAKPIIQNSENLNPPKKIISELIKSYQNNNIDAASKKISGLLKEYPQSFVLWNIKGAISDIIGDSEASIEAFQKVVSFLPTSYSGYSNLALAQKRKGQLDQALKSLEKAISLKPDYAPAHNNIASILKDKKDFIGAMKSAKTALKYEPEFPEALLNLGNIVGALDHSEEAIKCYQLALRFRPNYVEAINNLGLLYKNSENFIEAIKYFKLALDKSPEYTPSYLNLSNTYQSIGRLEEAIKYYHSALDIKSDFPEVYVGLGGIYRRQGNLVEAKKCFHRAIEINPNLAEAHNNLGVTLKQENEIIEAAKSYRKALEIDPKFVSAYLNLGTLFIDSKKLIEARDSLIEALRIEPSNEIAKIKLLQIAQQICDWERCKKIPEQNPGLGIDTRAIPGFIMLQAEDNPKNQLERAKVWVKSQYKITPEMLDRKPSKKTNEKIKIGYFGADFHEHATMHLMSGLLREHDYSKFEIHVFSYGHYKKGPQRKKAETAVTGFHDIHGMPDKQVIDLVRNINIDIALDLKGYTKYSRSELFAHRLAPLQINFLGFPNTMGADFIDYIIADKIIIPENLKKYYSEKVIYLPDCYQPNDNLRVIANRGVSRTDVNLPEDGFVLTCMNQVYKITDAEYNIWMRVLREVDGSVLWLLNCNNEAEKNLIEEAEKRGVSSSRIIFADAVKHSDHLERLKLADLFVDTFKVNAHTTASDALWAGLPVITKIGQQFAARVAASLLHNIGLPELVARTDKEYEELIFNLARDKQQLNRIKEKLKQNIRTAPLFDTERYTEHFEKELLKAFKDFHEKNL